MNKMLVSSTGKFLVLNDKMLCAPTQQTPDIWKVVTPDLSADATITLGGYVNARALFGWAGMSCTSGSGMTLSITANMAAVIYQDQLPLFAYCASDAVYDYLKGELQSAGFTTFNEVFAPIKSSVWLYISCNTGDGSVTVEDLLESWEPLDPSTTCLYFRQNGSNSLPAAQQSWLTSSGAVALLGDDLDFSWCEDCGGFENCLSLTSVDFSGSFITLDQYAFAGCTALASVRFAQVSNINSHAFYDCSALTDVYYGGAAEGWAGVNIDENGNEALLTAQMHYNS